MEMSRQLSILFWVAIFVSGEAAAEMLIRESNRV